METLLDTKSQLDTKYYLQHDQDIGLLSRETRYFSKLPGL